MDDDPCRASGRHPGINGEADAPPTPSLSGGSPCDPELIDRCDEFAVDNDEVESVPWNDSMRCIPPLRWGEPPPAIPALVPIPVPTTPPPPTPPPSKSSSFIDEYTIFSTSTLLCPPITLAPEPSLDDNANVCPSRRRRSSSFVENGYSPPPPMVVDDIPHGYRHAIDEECPSSIGMFNNAPLILRLNSTCNGVVGLVSGLFDIGIIVDGDPVPGGGVDASLPLLLLNEDDDEEEEDEYDEEFGSPFSPVALRDNRRACSLLDNFSNVLPRFLSTDSTAARHMSTRNVERFGMNRSPVYRDGDVPPPAIPSPKPAR